MDGLERLLYHLSAYSGEYMLALAVSVMVLAILVLLFYSRLSRFMKPLSRLEKSGASGEELVPSLCAALEDSRAAIDRLRTRLDRIDEEGKNHLRHVGLVKYDAFDDIGGKQSYSLCLLDAKRNGFLITFLTGKSFTRSYAVEITEGKHSRRLGDEELQAYREAASGITGEDS